MSTLSYRPTSNGTGGNIAFTIDSFSESEIEVYVDGVKRTNGGSNNFDFTIPDYSATSGTVTWNTSGSNAAPTSSNKVRIERRTKVLNNSGNTVEGKATFSAGAAVKATDLNNNTKQVLRAVQELQDGLIQTYDIEPDAITSAKIADDQINSEHYVAGSIDHEHLGNDIIDGSNIQDDVINSEHYAAGSIDEEHLSNSAITANKIADGTVGTLELANGAVTSEKIATNAISGSKISTGAVNTDELENLAVTTAKIAADAIDGTKIANNSIDSEHLVNGSIDRIHLADNLISGDQIQDDVVNSEHIAAGALDNEHYAAGSITSDKLNGATVITSSEQGSATTNDTSFLTSAAADARFFNISSGDTIKDGQTFPDNDTTIATTAAINDRIIDIVNDIGGFDIIQSEQHFPDTNPQGVAGQAAVLSIKAASTDLVPSGTTVTITNGNLANNANIIITGVTSTIPQDFGFLVESTSTLHTYSFHRLVPKATEVTTVAGKATEIGRLGTAAAVEDMSILGTADVVADLNTLGTADVVSDMNALAVTDVINDMNTLAVTDVISDMDVVATNVTNVNNVGNNVTNVNSVSNSAGANQTFTVTVQNVSGNKYFIDGVQTPVLKLARGKTYTFNLADSSNSGHPLAFRDSSDNSYTTGVTTNGTAGSSGATVVIVVAANAPSSLKYYCTSHGNSMGNTITVIDDNVGTVAGSISNVNTVGNAITNVNNVGNDISNVNTVASNISSVNSFFNTYRIGSSNPTSSLDTGDLFFNTTSNSLKVYTGSAWVDGVTATGNFAVVTGNTFTGSNNHNDNVKSIYGTGSDLEIFHDGNFSRIKDVGTGDLVLQSNTVSFVNAADSETLAQFKQDGSVDLYYDNVKKLETTSGGVHVLGTLEGDNLKASNPGNNALLIQNPSNGIIGFGANNQTNQVTISTDGHLGIPSDSGRLRLGAAEDFQIYHDATDNIIQAFGSPKLRLRHSADDGSNVKNAIVTIADGAVELYHNNSKKFETTSIGTRTTGVLQVTDATSADAGNRISVGTSQDIRIYHVAGNDSYIRNYTGDFYLQGNNSGTIVNNIKFENSTGATEIYYNGTKKLETTADGATINGVTVSTGNIQINNDTGKIRLGASQDLEIYHDGSNSYLNNTGTGALILQGNGSSDVSVRAVSGESGVVVKPNGGASLVELYYNNSKKFETTNDGVKVGSVTIDSGFNNIGLPDNGQVRFGAGEDLRIYHDGSNSRIADVGTGYLINTSNGDGILFQTSNGQNLAKFLTGGAAELYHNTNKKLETTSGGVTVTGTVTATSFSGDGSNLTGVTSVGGSTGVDFNDNVKARFGTGNDLEIYHNGTNSYIRKSTGQLLIGGTGGDLVLEALGDVRTVSWEGENMIYAKRDAEVELYYNNVKKFATYGSGVRLGAITNTLLWPTFANTSASRSWGFIGEDGAYGKFELKCSNGNDETLDEVSARFYSNGEVQLLYDNSLKFRTLSTGAQIYSGDLRFVTGSWTGEACKIQHHSNILYIQGGSNADYNISLRSNAGSDRIYMAGDGTFYPQSNGSQDLGKAGNRWQNIYTSDLDLSNEAKGANDIDGTWGHYTIVEGESDLFLKNNRSGKKYKFNLTEVS